MKPNYKLIESLLRENPMGGQQPAVPAMSPSMPGLSAQDVHTMIARFEDAVRSGDRNASEMIKAQIQAMVQQAGVR